MTRQPVGLRRGDEAGGQAAGVPAAQFHGEPGDPYGGQAGDVGVEQGALVRQRDPGGEHQFAAAQQPGRVGQFDRMHPPDQRAEPVGPRHHPRLPAPHHVQREHLGHRRQHCASSRTDPALPRRPRPSRRPPLAPVS
jgi:hypothetical protein